MKLSLFCILGLLTIVTRCQNVVEIQTETARDGNMNLGNIRIKLFNGDVQTCETPDLNNEGNNFQNYQTDTFEVSYNRLYKYCRIIRLCNFTDFLKA